MKRKKGEQREEGGGLVCHGLRVSLCASSSPRRGLRWVGADVPIFPAWPGAGCGVRAPGAGQLAPTRGWAPRAALPHLPTWFAHTNSWISSYTPGQRFRRSDSTSSPGTAPCPLPNSTYPLLAACLCFFMRLSALLCCSRRERGRAAGKSEMPLTY